ncbi:hypothetical protein ACWDUL_20285 [Nocardia niigatensis]
MIDAADASEFLQMATREGIIDAAYAIEQRITVARRRAERLPTPLVRDTLRLLYAATWGNALSMEETSNAERVIPQIVFARGDERLMWMRIHTGLDVVACEDPEVFAEAPDLRRVGTRQEPAPLWTADEFWDHLHAASTTAAVPHTGNRRLELHAQVEVLAQVMRTHNPAALTVGGLHRGERYLAMLSCGELARDHNGIAPRPDQVLLNDDLYQEVMAARTQPASLGVGARQDREIVVGTDASNVLAGEAPRTVDPLSVLVRADPGLGSAELRALQADTGLGVDHPSPAVEM